MILKLKNTNFSNKRPFLIDNIDIIEIVASNKVSFGKEDFKYFTGYKDAKQLDLYAYSFQKISAYRGDFDKVKCVFFDKRWKIFRNI